MAEAPPPPLQMLQAAEVGEQSETGLEQKDRNHGAEVTTPLLKHPTNTRGGDAPRAAVLSGLKLMRKRARDARTGATAAP